MNYKIRQISVLVLTSIFLVSFQSDKQFTRLLAVFHDSGSSYVMVAGHRSAGNPRHVENSVSAIKSAIKAGVDIIELDVKVTLDSVVVLNHDRNIDRTTNGTGDPESYTWEELSKFRLKKPDGKLTKERLATFEEALLLAKGKALIDIDIKTDNLKPVVDAIKRTGTQNQVFFFDNDYDALHEVLEMLPEALIMPRAYSYEMADSALRVFSPAVVHIDPKFYTPEVTRLLKENNARIWFNALGNSDKLIRAGEGTEAVDELLKHGANIIQTDEPKKLIRILKKRGLRKIYLN